ncbi:MAG: hypothetical protein JXR63_12115 [Spirochaetales bacterium]|nr:hypothetical protein [Spirochaetales bacterium]
MKKFTISTILVLATTMLALLLFSDILLGNLSIYDVSPAQYQTTTKEFDLSFKLKYKDGDNRTAESAIESFNIKASVKDESGEFLGFNKDVTATTNGYTNGDLNITIPINLETICGTRLNEINNNADYTLELKVFYTLKGTTEEKSEIPKGGIITYKYSVN